MGCCSGQCGKCKGWMKIVTGALILLNGFVWPLWTGIDGWIKWFGVLMVLGGLVKMIKPTCGHCDVEMTKKKK